MVTGNALNISQAGLVKFDGTSTFIGVTTTNHDVLVGDASNGITSVGPGTAGQVLQSGGAAADPTYSTATFPATAGTAGKVMISDGTNWVQSTPIYSNSVGGAGTILRSNGTTGWIASGSTWMNGLTVNSILYASSTNTQGQISPANNGVLVTNNTSTGVPSILAGPGTTGNILQSNAAAAPSFSTATYPSTAGTSGKVLISNGTNIVSSTPTFPNASATSGKFIQSDGTNWIASTPTLPTSAGTSGNVLTSDGTNWVSSAPAAGGGPVFFLNAGAGNPADATTYYLAFLNTINTFTLSNLSCRYYMTSSLTITKVYGALNVAGTLGTAENATLALRKNDTSNTNITTTLQFNTANSTFNNTGLSLSVAAGDFIEVILICPTWVTNPTTAKITLSFS